MKRIFLPFSIFLVLVLVSCETEIKFDGPLTDPMLTVNCLACTDSTIHAEITASRFFLDNRTSFTKIEDATVNLFVNGSLREQLVHQGEGSYSGNYIVQEGDLIRLNVTASGYHDVWTETTVPKSVTQFQIDTTFAKQDSSFILEGKYTEYGNSGYEGYNWDTVGVNYNRMLIYKVRFANVPGVREYYRLVIYREYVNGQYSSISEYKNDVEDIVFTSKKEGLDGLMEETGYDPFQVFTDELIDGTTHTITFTSRKSLNAYYDNRQNLPENKRSGENLVVDVQSISKDYYLHLTSLKARNASDPIMSEPVQIYTNVRDGLGLLGARTHKLQKIDLTK